MRRVLVQSAVAMSGAAATVLTVGGFLPDLLYSVCVVTFASAYIVRMSSRPRHIVTWYYVFEPIIICRSIVPICYRLMRNSVEEKTTMCFLER